MKTLLLQFHLLVYPLQTIQNLLFMGNRHPRELPKVW